MKYLVLFFSMTIFLAAQDVQKKEQQYYAAIFSRGSGWDTSVTANGQLHFKEHGLNLSRLKKEGKIAFGARYGEFGMVVFKSDTEEEVRGHFTADSVVRKSILKLEIQKFNPFYKGCIE